MRTPNRVEFDLDGTRSNSSTPRGSRHHRPTRLNRVETTPLRDCFSITIDREQDETPTEPTAPDQTYPASSLVFSNTATAIAAASSLTAATALPSLTFTPLKPLDDSHAHATIKARHRQSAFSALNGEVKRFSTSSQISISDTIRDYGTLPNTPIPIDPNVNTESPTYLARRFSALSRAESRRIKRLSMRNIDAGVLSRFEGEDRNAVSTLGHALLATAIVRIWPSLLLTGSWATAICCINQYTNANLVVSNQLLTVLGTVLGLILAYRTSSAYERYTEGRKLFSSIIVHSRTLSRIIWVHCPDGLEPVTPTREVTEEERVQCRREKRMAVELCLAFAVAVKHYLRGEDGIYYEDLWDLVKGLPTYHIPSGMPPSGRAYEADNDYRPPELGHSTSSRRDRISDTPNPYSHSEADFRKRKDIGRSDSDSGDSSTSKLGDDLCAGGTHKIPFSETRRPKLRPARNPPRHHWSDSQPIRYLPWAKRQRRKRRLNELSYGYGSGHDLDDCAAILGGNTHSIPLEITMTMSAFVGELQRRNTIDVPTTNAMLLAIGGFTDTLGSLERVLTTPIPFSYAAHIFEVSWLYSLLLPFQIYQAYKWITIPATIIVTYILLGLIECGQEIENPFGYDKNDLNLDYFCEYIIKQELMAITSKPPQGPAVWNVPEVSHLQEVLVAQRQESLSSTTSRAEGKQPENGFTRDAGEAV